MNLKNVCTLMISAALIGTGYVMNRGCPTAAIESNYTLGQCTRLGYFRTWSDFAPNATAIEQFGNQTLENWGTNLQELRARFETTHPDARFTSDFTECLTGSETRPFYKKLTSLIPSFISRSKDPLDQAFTASELRAQVRVGSRSLMCDQREVEILEERDRSKYGTARPNFAYMIGKYAMEAISKCNGAVCDIKNATCQAIIGSAQQTNAIWTFLSKFF